MSDRPHHWGVVGTVAWGIAIAVAVTVIQIIVVGFYVASAGSGLSKAEVRALTEAVQVNGFVLSVATLLTAMLCVPLIFGVVKLKRGSRLVDYMALNAVPMTTLGKWLGITALFLVASDALSTALGRPVVPEFMRSVYSTADPSFLLWLALVVGAPLFEEFFFRGFLFKGLESAIKPIATIVVTAAIWAAIHLQYDLFDISTVFVLGLLLGAARWRTGSILVPLAMHALANFVATVEVALLP